MMIRRARENALRERTSIYDRCRRNIRIKGKQKRVKRKRLSFAPYLRRWIRLHSSLLNDDAERKKSRLVTAARTTARSNAYYLSTLTIMVTLSPFNKILPIFVRTFFFETSSASSSTKFMYSSNPTIWPSMQSPFKLSNNHICTRAFVCRNLKIKFIGCVIILCTLVAIFSSLFDRTTSLSLSLFVVTYSLTLRRVMFMQSVNVRLLLSISVSETRAKKGTKAKKSIDCRDRSVLALCFLKLAVVSRLVLLEFTFLYRNPVFFNERKILSFFGFRRFQRRLLLGNFLHIIFPCPLKSSRSTINASGLSLFSEPVSVWVLLSARVSGVFVFLISFLISLCTKRVLERIGKGKEGNIFFCAPWEFVSWFARIKRSHSYEGVQSYGRYCSNRARARDFDIHTYI